MKILLEPKRKEFWMSRLGKGKFLTRFKDSERCEEMIK